MSETPAPDAPASRWEDFIDVFIAPAQLFRRRIDGKFGHALLMLLVLTAVIFFATRSAMQPIMDAEFQRGMAASPNLTPEQVETARKFSSSLAPVFILIGLPIAVFLLGAVVWLGARVVGGRVSYAQGATIAAFAFFPRVIEGVVSGAQALLMDEGKLTSRLSVSLGVGRFLEAGQVNGILLALLGRIDVFTIWVTVLIAVGLKQMARITNGQAAAAGALVWLIGAVPVLLQALRS